MPSHFHKAGVAAVSASLLLAFAASPARATHDPGDPLVDRPMDCGADHRDPFDMQPEVDYPLPPPAEAQPLLGELGCPAGEPTYGRFEFYPSDDDAGESGAPASYEQTEPRRARRPRRRACPRRTAKHRRVERKTKRCSKRHRRTRR